MNSLKVLYVLLILTLGLPLSASARHWPDKRPRKERKIELPRFNKEEKVISHSAYTVSYNPQTLVPNWVAYELTAEETDGPWSRKGLNFIPDPDYDGVQADHADFKGSGYSRGHLAPAGDMKWDSLAMIESFYFTNCMPQETKFNNGKWNQLEEKTRRWAKQYGSVFIVCGPAYLSSDTVRIGHHGVAVADACFKALLIPNGDEYSAIAFLMRNGGEDRPLNECAMTVDELESILNIDLFCNLPKRTQRSVESAVDWDVWDCSGKK